MKNLLLLLLFLGAALPSYAQTARPTAQTNLQGQIVCCADCWAEADRRTVTYGTPADLAKAANCIAKGDPTLLAVLDAAGKTTFYQLEEGLFKKPGKTWLEFVGKTVALSGTVRTVRKKQLIRIDTLNVLASPAAPDISAFLGKEAELILKDLFNVEQKLSNQRGRIVILNFWATWCGPCKTEMPDLAAIQNQYAALGVQVIGAAADTFAEAKAVRQFIKDAALNFPIWLGATTEQMAAFGVGPGLPATIIINREGKIAAIFPGVITQAEIKKQLDKLIAQAETQARREQIAAAKNQKPTVAASVPS